MSTKSLVEESLTPPGYWGSDASQIHVVKDFINQEQSQIFNNYIRTNETWNQNQNHENWIDRVHSIDIFVDLTVKDLAQKITNNKPETVKHRMLINKTMMEHQTCILKTTLLL